MFRQHSIRQFALLTWTCCFLSAPVFAQSVTLPIIDVAPDSDASKKSPTSVSQQSHQASALSLLQQGKLNEAVKEAEAALDEANKGPRKDVIASCYAVLGKVYRRQDRYGESVGAYHQALQYWKTQEKSDFLQAMILNNLAEAYQSMGSLDKAAFLLIEAKSKISEDAPDYWAIVENLGAVYFQQNKPAEAEKSWKKAVVTASKGKDHRSEVDSLTGLTLLYLKQARVDDAHMMRDSAIAKVTEYFGPTDPRAVALSRLPIPPKGTNTSVDPTQYNKHMTAGAIATKQNDQATAEKEYVAAVKEAEKFGERDERLPTALNDLAVAYSAQQKLSESIPIYLRAIHLIEMNAGPSSPRLAELLNAVAIAYGELGNFSEAEPYMKRALPLLEGSLGSDSLRVQQSKKLYEFILSKSGKQ